jgi:Protein of unknown function (DUF1326)
MTRWLILAALALAFVAAPAKAAGLSGSYLEARTADVYTGPCFANSDMNLTGREAILAWKVDKGSLDDVALDGLSVVAVVAASDTLGLKQTGSARAVLIVDSRADDAQRDALVRLAKHQGGELVRNVVAVRTSAIDLKVGGCSDGGCARLRAGEARVETRCIDHEHDKVCGNESAFYPPLARDVKVRPALAVENAYSGKGVNETWNDAGRRGAYLGSFAAR